MAKILVVEDFEDSRFSLCRLLEMSGHTVVEAFDGRHAIEQAREHRPDLILMDLSLPVIDGLEATRRIRSEEAGQMVPIVAVTAHDSSHVEADAADLDFAAYVTKPIDFDELESLIGRILAG